MSRELYDDGIVRCGRSWTITIILVGLSLRRSYDYGTKKCFVSHVHHNHMY